MNRGRILRLVARVLAIAGAILAVLAVRVVLASHGELDKARALEEEGKLDAAIVHYRRAARWYAPGSPYPADALTALAEIGARAEKQDERQRALMAWRAIRAAIMSTRSFYVPYEARLREANQHIATLMAEGPRPPVDAGKSEAQLRREHLKLLNEPSRPQVGWTFVLLVGFAAWVAGAFAFATRAIDEEDRLVRHQAFRWGAVVLIGFALFVIGMAFA